MGRIPRKCKLRGPCRIAYGSWYISLGPNWENPAEIRQTWGNKIGATSSENLSNLAKFGEKISKFSAIFDENFEH